VRHVDKFVERHENEWPIARTKWTKMFLCKDFLLKASPGGEGTVSFDAMGDGVTFLSEPIESDTEITRPLAPKLKVSSTTEAADLFLVFRVFTPDLREITFMGAIAPHTPIAQGWLRASHRKLDKKLSQPWRPYHAHDEKQPLKKGEPVDLDVEL